MTTLTAFEHERIDFDWNGRHLRAVERLNRALGTTVLQATTHRGRRVLKAGHYVGVVRFGRDTIQILPKIDYGQDETGSATRNLLYLLEAAGNFPVRRHDIATLADLRFAWEHRILPLLQEYFYNDYERLRAVLAGRFVESTSPSDKAQEALGEWYDPDIMHYQFSELSDEEFLAALREVAGLPPSDSEQVA